jgi:membrane fusion protein (multidrug efflux system)
MSKSRLRKPVALLLTFALTLALGWWLYQRATHIYTDDARVAANMIAVSSKAPGWVVDFPISQGEKLAKNQLMLQVDQRETELRTRELETHLRSV